MNSWIFKNSCEFFEFYFKILKKKSKIKNFNQKFELIEISKIKFKNSFRKKVILSILFYDLKKFEFLRIPDGLKSREKNFKPEV